ncbi:MAG: GNAT family N-acetyltransferase [Phycisphaerales bacterium]|nr:GNAT family N-acetyltransferase [Phycisphaerales bacterium]
MLIFASGTIANSRAMMGQVRDLVTTFDRPAACIDANHGWQADPVASMRDPHRHKLEQVGALIDRMWADGVRTFVIALPESRPEERADQQSRAAFWFQRTASQPAYALDIDSTVRVQHGGTWTKETFDAAIKNAVKALRPEQAMKPWMPEPPVYQTERLTLTWPTTPQLDQYYQAIVGTDIFDTLLWNGPSTPQDMHDHWVMCRQEFARGAEHMLSLAIIERASGVMIGGCSLRPQRLNGAWHDLWDIGYALAKPWHGKGYATEAVRVLVDAAFKERKAERVYANAFVGNQASRRVLEKLGFALDGTTRAAVAKAGGRRDEWLMGITRRDWQGS